MWSFLSVFLYFLLNSKQTGTYGKHYKDKRNGNRCFYATDNTPLESGQGKIEIVSEFPYLGSTVLNDGDLCPELSNHAAG